MLESLEQSQQIENCCFVSDSLWILVSELHNQGLKSLCSPGFTLSFGRIHMRGCPSFCEHSVTFRLIFNIPSVIF